MGKSFEKAIYEKLDELLNLVDASKCGVDTLVRDIKWLVERQEVAIADYERLVKYGYEAARRGSCNFHIDESLLHNDLTRPYRPPWGSAERREYEEREERRRWRFGKNHGCD